MKVSAKNQTLPPNAGLRLAGHRSAHGWSEARNAHKERTLFANSRLNRGATIHQSRRSPARQSNDGPNGSISRCSSRPTLRAKPGGGQR
jgi:hypothetical protein